MSQPTRVLHLINSLAQGGAERSLVELLPRLRERSIESHVAVLRRTEDSFEDEVRQLGVPLIDLRSPGRLTAPFRVRQTLRRVRPSLLHTTLFDADLIGRLGAVLTAVPVVSSQVNMAYSVPRGDDPNVSQWKLALVRWLDGITARHLAAAHHAVSGPVWRMAVTELGVPPESVTVIPRGRDRARLGIPSLERRRRVRHSLGIAPSTPVVVNVGRQEYQKDQETLLRAQRILLDRGLQTSVLLVGRAGNASESLREVAGRNELQESVRFMGYRSDVTDLVAASDVFAFPSRFEGLPGSVLEAMALDVPVVASDIPPNRDVLDGGRNGLLVPVADAEALADAIQDTLEGGDEVARRVAAARAAFEGVYDLDRVADDMGAWFRSVAEQRADR